MCRKARAALDVALVQNEVDGPYVVIAMRPAAAALRNAACGRTIGTTLVQAECSCFEHISMHTHITVTTWYSQPILVLVNRAVRLCRFLYFERPNEFGTLILKARWRRI